MGARIRRILVRFQDAVGRQLQNEHGDVCSCITLSVAVMNTTAHAMPTRVQLWKKVGIPSKLRQPASRLMTWRQPALRNHGIHVLGQSHFLCHKRPHAGRAFGRIIRMDHAQHAVHGDPRA